MFTVRRNGMSRDFKRFTVRKMGSLTSNKELFRNHTEDRKFSDILPAWMKGNIRTRKMMRERPDPKKTVLRLSLVRIPVVRTTLYEHINAAIILLAQPLYIRKHNLDRICFANANLGKHVRSNQNNLWMMTFAESFA